VSRRRFLLSILITVVVWLAAVWTPAVRAQPQPILILISIDGWRWDYLDRVDVPALRSLAARGVRSEGLIPSFPTLTFPNHWTIVTGLLPDHHGIVSNTILDRSIGPARFSMSALTAKDERWWGGEPIWKTAMRQGRKAAAMFWPGSEAVLPTYWKPYDTKVPNPDRVDQVLGWLALPEADRPAFSTLYFSDVDSAAHSTGPDSEATFAAARRVDGMIGRLIAGLTQTGLINRTTLMVVSDHGLAETSVNRLIVLDDYLSRSDVEVVDSGAWLGINPGPSLTTDAIVERLSGRHQALTVYRKESLPPELQYGSHRRIPAVVGLVEPGWLVTSRDLAARNAATGWKTGGAHGYSTRTKEMRGLFVAAGPRVQRGVTVGPIENIHLYHFMCEVLGVRASRNDGDPARTATLLVK
jgi:predicted AlkP superfamily pyrophosphatase or phosphodiesterase